jgi:hypothetical protein
MNTMAPPATALGMPVDTIADVGSMPTTAVDGDSTTRCACAGLPLLGDAVGDVGAVAATTPPAFALDATALLLPPPAERDLELPVEPGSTARRSLNTFMSGCQPGTKCSHIGNSGTATQSSGAAAAAAAVAAVAAPDGDDDTRSGAGSGPAPAPATATGDGSFTPPSLREIVPK